MTVLNIDLIAARRRQRQRAATLARAGVYSSLGLCVIGVLAYLQMFVATQQVRSKIDTIQAELSSPGLSAKVEHVQLLEKETKELTPRVQLLERVHGSEAAWIRILYDVSNCIPQNVWLAQMSTKRSEKEQVVTLKGRALRQAEIGSFMLALGEPGWSNVPALSFSQANVDPRAATRTFDFEITVPLKSVIGSDLK